MSYQLADLLGRHVDRDTLGRVEQMTHGSRTTSLNYYPVSTGPESGLVESIDNSIGERYSFSYDAGSRVDAVTLPSPNGLLSRKQIIDGPTTRTRTQL